MLQGEHSVLLSTFIKLPFVTKIYILSIFECFYKGSTVMVLSNKDKLPCPRTQHSGFGEAPTLGLLISSLAYSLQSNCSPPNIL